MEDLHTEHITNPELFFKTNELQLLPGYSLFQHPQWMRITYPKCDLSAFISRNGNKIQAYGLVIERSATARIFFGPLARNEETAAQFALSIARYYRKKKFGLLCILPHCGKSYGKEYHNPLEAAGFKIQEGTMIRNWSSLVLELNTLPENPADLFSENHKRNIRKALNAGFTVKEIRSNKDVLKFAEIFRQMYTNRKISLPFHYPEKTFKEIAVFFQEQKTGCMMGAYNKEDNLIGGIILGFHGDRIFYHYGVSDPGVKGMPVLHMIFDEAIRSARNAGFHSFDFGGYDTTAIKGSQLASINRFKEGFHGTLVHNEDVLEIPLNPMKYKMVKGALWLWHKTKK